MCSAGLEDQLLGKLILKEKHELEEQRQQLLEEVQSYKKKIKQLEDDLLFRWVVAGWLQPALQARKVQLKPGLLQPSPLPPFPHVTTNGHLASVPVTSRLHHPAFLHAHTS